MTKLTPVNAGIYCRISDDRAGGGLGVERQRQDCLRLAETLGWAVVDTYIDNDISAYSGKRRPEYERLLADVITGRITGILTWHLDRVNRSPIELERLIDLLERHAVAVQTVTAGPIDLSTPTGRAVARTLGAWARYESEHKGERIRAKQVQRAQQGLPNGGANRPYGYGDDKVTVIPAEAKVIREAMRRFLAGQSVRSIAHRLNDRGDFTTGGHPWRSSSLSQILVSGRIAGWRDQPRTAPAGRLSMAPFLVKAQWPAIVSRADVTRARELMTDETIRPGSHCRWLLSGIVVCGNCHIPLTSSLADTPKRRYVCMKGRAGGDRCGHLSVTARIDDDIVDRLHAAVADGLIHRIRASPSAFTATRQGAAAATQRLARLDYERNHAMLTPNEWILRRNLVLRASKIDRAAVAALPVIDLRAIDKAARFPGAWTRMSTRERRALLRVVTAEIAIGPGRHGDIRYNADRVHITWRA